MVPRRAAAAGYRTNTGRAACRRRGGGIAPSCCHRRDPGLTSRAGIRQGVECLLRKQSMIRNKTYGLQSFYCFICPWEASLGNLAVSLLTLLPCCVSVSRITMRQVATHTAGRHAYSADKSPRFGPPLHVWPPSQAPSAGPYISWSYWSQP